MKKDHLNLYKININQYKELAISILKLIQNLCQTHIISMSKRYQLDIICNGIIINYNQNYVNWKNIFQLNVQQKHLNNYMIY